MKPCCAAQHAGVGAGFYSVLWRLRAHVASRATAPRMISLHYGAEITCGSDARCSRLPLDRFRDTVRMRAWATWHINW